MGREVKRVPLDFDAPSDKTWEGYVMPDELREEQCEDCRGRGYSRAALRLHDLWYGNAPFRPEDNGSVPFMPEHPVVRARAERNAAAMCERIGREPREYDIAIEAQRLADHFNNGWLHHLNEADVAALIDGGRLRDLTHTWDPERERRSRWLPKEPPYVPTPAEVNEWSISGMGHDAINAHIVIKARCERERLPELCAARSGHGSHERYPGQRADAEAWERYEPPTGEGWQLWQTVSDAPLSPVFATADELIEWMTTPAAKWGASGPWSHEDAAAFVNGPGWAPTGIGSQDGVTAMAQHARSAAS